jgi:hypothetical protein
MNPEKFIEIEGLKIEWIKEGMATIGFERRFAITLRVTNQSDQKSIVALNPEYISISRGWIDGVHDMSPSLYSGEELLPKSFVDVKIAFEGIKRSMVSDGDRMKLKISKIASLLLRRDNSQWYFVEYSSIKIGNDEIKSKIEQFEAIEERIGIALQNFSVQVKDEHSFDLYIETLVTDEERCREFQKIPLKLVVYDKENNVIHMQGLNLYNNGYSIFQVLEFPVKISETTLSNINKIRIFPSL